MNLSPDQAKAWEKLSVWATQADPTDKPYFVLRGYAGTGKTFLLKLLTTLSCSLQFTAPTNKATKVLGHSVGSDASTTYSALGLRLVHDEDSVRMDFGDRIPYLPKGSILVVDEAGMVNTDLYQFIERARSVNQCKVLYVGDPAQLPPVNEETSPTWQATADSSCRAFLKQVMRFDNQLLNLATDIRECIVEQDWSSPIRSANDADGGVYLMRENKFRKFLLTRNSPEEFLGTKLIAWRNVTVESYNDLLRKSFGFTHPYQEGDRLLIASPVKVDGKIVATIDEEVRVFGVRESTRRLLGEEQLRVWELQVEREIGALELVVPLDTRRLQEVLSQLAHAARQAPPKQRKFAWDAFWELKDRFHETRYAYCLTAHRAQGSTYEEVFVDQRDILANPDKDTAFRCLYVACTRATNSVYTF